jgi:hypothetical protein
MRTLALVSAATIAGMHTPKLFAQEATPMGAIFNPLSDLCLQPLNGSTSLGAQIVQEPCNGSTAQSWKRTSLYTTRQYVNLLSGLCLDARGGAADYTPVQQWSCEAITNETWNYVYSYTPQLKSGVAGSSSYCLDMPGADTAAGVALQIYSCNGTLAQQWFTP